MGYSIKLKQINAKFTFSIFIMHPEGQHGPKPCRHVLEMLKAQEGTKRAHQGFPLVCFSISSLFSSLENCRSSSKELVSRSWIYCWMLLMEVNSGGNSERASWEDVDGASCMQLNWLRRSSYYSEQHGKQTGKCAHRQWVAQAIISSEREYGLCALS